MEDNSPYEIIDHVWRWKITIGLFTLVGIAASLFVYLSNAGLMVRTNLIHVYAGGTVLESREAIEEQLLHSLRLRGFRETAYDPLRHTLWLKREYSRYNPGAAREETAALKQAVKAFERLTDKRMAELLDVSRSIGLERPMVRGDQNDRIRLESYARARQAKLVSLVSMRVVEERKNSIWILPLVGVGLGLGLIYSIVAAAILDWNARRRKITGV